MKVKFYFCYAGRSMEAEVIRECKPPNLLLSYAFFKNKKLKDVKEHLGYNPNIFLDCGAFSGNVDEKAYLKYVEDNKDEIEKFMSVDVMNDGEQTFWNFIRLKQQGLNPVPVFHYGTDEKYLEAYYQMGERYVAIGSIVKQLKVNLVRQYINELAVKYTDIGFHVLGTSRRQIMDHCPIVSCDSSGWVRTASLKGKTREGRIKLGKEIMRKKMEFTC